jgi:beta-glucosidase
VRVRNVSDRAGSTVAQAYVSPPRATGEPPRRLDGYEKVRLGPGQSARATFALGPDDLSFYNGAAHGFVVAPGRFVGASSRDLPEHEDFAIGGRRVP